MQILILVQGARPAGEKHYLSLAIILIVVTDNQLKIAKTLQDLVQLIIFGWYTDQTEESTFESLLSLWWEPQTVAEMHNNAAQICDGLATQRVIDCFEKNGNT